MNQAKKMISDNLPAGWSRYATIALIAILMIIALWWFNLLPFNFNVNTVAKYQAVFLSNGQVYFGQLKSEKGDYALLSNIYYLQQVNVPVQQTAPAPSTKDDKGNLIQPQVPATQPDTRLVKLGSELHGPEDMMYIAKSQILFYEDLKDDSRVVQAIRVFEKK